MNWSVVLAPSFFAHALNGILLLVAFLVILKNRVVLGGLGFYKYIMVILLLSIAVGIHGLGHLGLERTYGFNPLRN